MLQEDNDITATARNVAQMKFKPSDHLIDLFVGQLVYSSPATAIRELLQNAYDACVLQKVDDPSFSQSITFRVSRSQNWFSVEDNGIGMDEEAIKESFAKVGGPKTEIPHLRDLIERGGVRAAQTAIFGIGILACFRIAENVTVSTKMDNKPALRFVIIDPKQPFDFQKEGLRSDRGTTVDVKLKTGAGFTANDVYNAVFEFARHVDNLVLVDVDAGESQEVKVPYDGEDFEDKIVLQADNIRYGVLALNESWTDPDGNWSNNLMLDNGGFFVQAHDVNLLPPYCFGYTGEIDFVPGKLRLMINRESFVKDENYSSISSHLLQQYLGLVEQRVRKWIGDSGNKKLMTREKKEILKPYLLTLEKHLPTDQTASTLRKLVESIIDEHIPFTLCGSTTKDITLNEARAQLGIGSTFFTYQPGVGSPAQVTEAFDEETTVSIARPIKTIDIKATLLGAQGKLVFTVSSWSKGIARGQQTLGYDMHAYLSKYCQKSGLHCIDISQVLDSEIQFGEVELTNLMNSILSYSQKLQFVSLRDSKRATLRDLDGHWVNINNAEIRKMLQSIPDIVGNPIKKEILLLYFDLVTLQFASARKRVEKLLLDTQFSERSRQRTGHFQAKCLKQLLESFITAEAKEGL